MLNLLCVASAGVSFQKAHAQANIDAKVEAYKKSLEADQRRREQMAKGYEIDWDEMVASSPRVIAFGLMAKPDFTLTGPYIGYMFNKHIELGLDSLFYYSSQTVKAKDNDPKVVTNTREYFFGPRFTFMMPLSDNFSIYAAVSPGVAGGLEQTKKTTNGNVTDEKTTLGPAFALRVIPIGVGWRSKSIEVRTGMYLQYMTGGADIGTEDGSVASFTFGHAMGMLEVRHYF